MSSAFDLAGTIVKTTAILATLTVAAAGTFAAITKPKDTTLKKDLQTDMTSSSDNIIEHAFDVAAAKLTTATLKTNVKDYIFFKTADVQFADGSKQTYVGAFQNWYPVKNFNL